MKRFPRVKDRAIAFWLRVNKTEGCWAWIGSINANGYGNWHQGGGIIRLAHRNEAVWGRTLLADEVVDHKCRNRACVNPSHLRIVDLATNALENNGGPVAANALKTHCPRGHEYDYVWRNQRHCLTCKALRAGRIPGVDRRKQPKTVCAQGHSKELGGDCRECHRLYMQRRRAQQRSAASCG